MQPLALLRAHGIDCTACKAVAEPLARRERDALMAKYTAHVLSKTWARCHWLRASSRRALPFLVPHLSPR